MHHMLKLPIKFSTTVRCLFIGAAFASCVLGLLLQSSRVLCVGADGHRQVEAAIRACCPQPTQLPTSVTIETTILGPSKVSDSHCGNCTDIPLVSPSYTIPSPLRVLAADFSWQPLFSFQWTSGSFASEDVQPFGSLAHAPHLRSTLSSLRATVIRI